MIKECCNSSNATMLAPNLNELQLQPPSSLPISFFIIFCYVYFHFIVFSPLLCAEIGEERGEGRGHCASTDISILSTYWPISADILVIFFRYHNQHRLAQDYQNGDGRYQYIQADFFNTAWGNSSRLSSILVNSRQVETVRLRISLKPNKTRI